MEFLNKMKKFNKIVEYPNCDSFWTLNDDCSNGSLSTTSLSIDADELKYMDDDSASSSSDEIYSLETSLIEMNIQDEQHSEDDKPTYNQNCCYQHQPSPIVGRTINFYDNDNFTDDTLCQLANKGFAQSLSRQNFVQKQTFHNEDPPLDGFLSQLKDKHNPISCNAVTNDGVIVLRKFINRDNLMERSFEMELLDNDDLISISSHGSDRSLTPVEKTINRTDEENVNNTKVGSTLPDNQSIFCPNTIHVVKPKLLKFTDYEDIESLSPGDCNNEKCVHDNDADDEDCSTVCGDHWSEYQDIESNHVTLYHQAPKSADRAAAQRLARRLFDLDGFKVNDVSKHLSKKNDFSQLVGEEFANFFEFVGLTLDSALRQFLQKFILCGDTQERERVIHHFSRRYLQCNPNAYCSEDACHTLVCALMLLNTDLHGHTLNRKMTCDDFVVSMRDLNNGGNFNNNELIQLFNSIFDSPIRWNLDNELIGLIQPKLDFVDFNKPINKTNFNFYQEVPSEATSKEYMNGYLLRKCIKESYFQRTSLGKRGWKLYFGRLQDLTLYLYKDEVSMNGSLRRSSRKLDKEKNGNSYSEPFINQIASSKPEITDKKTNGSDHKKPRKSSRLPRMDKQNSVISNTKNESEKNPCSATESTRSNNDLYSTGSLQIYLNHSFSSKATDYSKKRNVFRLQVNSGSEYLFQVNEPREVELWVDCLNFVAALLSPPVFCSNKDMSDSSVRKSNPTLTTLNIKDQLESHQRCVLVLEQDLMKLTSKPPSKSDKTKLKWQYNRQRKFVEKELIRYKTYARLLEFELIHLHNVAMARISQQAFIDPYLIPIQYSQVCGSSPLFYNQQTNQFIPVSCIPANVPVFQYQFGYSDSLCTSNNSSIKELSEDVSPQIILSAPVPEPTQTQPVIIRPALSCTRGSRAQLNMAKRRRYRNSSLLPSQHQQQSILMPHPFESSTIPNIKQPLLSHFVPTVQTNPTNDVTSNITPLPYIPDPSAQQTDSNGPMAKNFYDIL